VSLNPIRAANEDQATFKEQKEIRRCKKSENGNSIVKVLRKGDDWEIIKETFPLLSCLSVVFFFPFTSILSHQKCEFVRETKEKY
jgi:hypothetical protein